MLKFEMMRDASFAAADAFQIKPGPVSTLKIAGCMNELGAGFEGLTSSAPRGIAQRQVVEFGQVCTREDVASIHAPHTPREGTTGHVQFPVGHEIGSSEMFGDSIPVYMAAVVDRSAEGVTNRSPGTQLS